MVAQGGVYGSMEEAALARPEPNSYRRLAIAAACLMALCVAAVTVRHAGGVALREQPSELLDDAVHVADKILSTQRFHKADAAQREDKVKKLLGVNHEHKSGKAMVGKIASIVADSKESYTQRMAAMKRLLDSQTDEIKGGSTPHHAAVKKASRGRKDVAADNAKAIKDAQKVLVQTALSRNHEAADAVHVSSQDAKKKQLEDKKKDAVKHLAAAKAAAAKTADSTPLSRHQKLIKWAEAHGLPKKLAENPKDRTKVKDIIARMKADLMVERIKKEFAHDDAKVKDVVHSADPSAADA